MTHRHFLDVEEENLVYMDIVTNKNFNAKDLNIKECQNLETIDSESEE